MTTSTYCLVFLYHITIFLQTNAVTDFPYQASLLVLEKHHCGCSIVQNNWVITSAGCVSDVNETEIQVATGINTSEGNTNTQRRSVQMFRVHPDYTGQQGSSDLALVQLSEPLELNDNVQIVLMARDEELSGQGNLTGYDFENILQYGQLNIISNTVCLWMITHNLQGSTLRVDERTNFCTKDYVKAACNGASGNPLVQEGRLLGVVSGTADPCGSGPTVFTKVAMFYDYIASILLDN